MASLPELARYDAGRTIGFAQAGQKQRTLADLGQYAAKGDYKGAEAAAFSGGETELGLHLKQMNDQDKQRLVSQAASWAYGADDPQKWEQGRQQWQQMGYDIGPFQSRDALLSQAMTIQDRMAQANSDRSFGLEQEKLAQAGAMGGGGGYGLNPIYGRDASGNIVPMQVGKNGEAVQTKLPPGVTALGPGGTAAERTSATVDAKTAGMARAALPGAEQAVTIAKNAVDLLRSNTKGMSEQFGSVLGVPQQWLPSIPKTERAKFLVDLQQASGQAFMQARQMLKGGGQITDFEGRRGEAAYSRMQAAADSGDQQQFLSALDDFEQAVDMGYQKLQAAASGGYAAGGANLSADAPQGDDIDALINQYAP